MVMKILLSDAGKRYNREWIFRHLNYEFSSGNAYAITGNNGSGKSTLLQVIAGAVHHNEGSITYHFNGKDVPAHEHFNHIAMAAPYLELVEEMTLTEFLEFHFNFKPLLPGCTVTDVINQLELQRSAGKQIRYFSSGMKQRVKLAQAVFSNVPVLLLDEPCTNLDAQGYALYHRLIEEFCNDRLIIVSSNDETEYKFCHFTLPVTSFKP